MVRRHPRFGLSLQGPYLYMILTDISVPVGTPPQTVTVVFDSGSIDLEIASE